MPNLSQLGVDLQAGCMIDTPEGKENLRRPIVGSRSALRNASLRPQPSAAGIRFNLPKRNVAELRIVPHTRRLVRPVLKWIDELLDWR